MRHLVTLPSVSADDVLDVLGLEKRRSTGARVASGLGFVIMGAAVGAALVLTKALLIGRAERQALLQPEGHPDAVAE